MKTLLLALAAGLGLAAAAHGQGNLLPNPDFNAPGGPFTGWRIDFPYWGAYTGNAPYFKISADHQQGSARTVEVSMPKAVAEAAGAKIESTFLKVDPGATYHGAVDVMTGDYTIKVQAEAWAVDPTPLTRSDLFRIPPRDGLPGLVMCYRSDFPDQGPGGKTWTTAQKDFKVPSKALVAGKPSQPSFLTLKVFVFSATTATVPAGKAYIGRTSLTEIKK